MSMLYLSGTVGDRFCVWPLENPVTGIGRSSKNTIQMVDATVSKEHAEIARQGDRYSIRDLGSRNGTRVNGVEVQQTVALKAGDRVEIGHVALRLTDDDPQPMTRLSESTNISSALRIRADQIIDRRTSEARDSSKVLKLLSEAGRLLVLPRPLKEMCEEILRLVEQAVPASRLIVLLKPSPDAEPTQIAARYKGGSAREPLVLSRAIIKSVLEENAAVLITDAAMDPRFQHQQSIVASAMHSAMAVPLYDNEKVLGLLYADTNALTTTYGQEELEVLALVANMAAVKITNARLLETEQARLRMAQELATATGIQRSLLPHTAPSVPGYRFHAFLESCYEVGGDLYDYHLLPDGSLYFMLGDVSGKGMGAALLMSSVLASARVLYDACTDLVDLITRLNAVIFRSTESQHFVTAFVGQLDPARGTLRYVNAGHPPPYLVSGGAATALESTGVPIGILPSFPFSMASLEMKHGDLLAVFSDGIPEAKHGDEFYDDERIAKSLVDEAAEQDLDALSTKIINRVMAFVGDEPRGDDITLVLLKRE
jgi:sigma-B regulation protein RsbU (phosphoserine phosphatase)